MTFSVVARCAETGMLGVAVSSSSPAVGARCAHARASVGAVASQNITDPRLGRRALDLMELGSSAEQAIEAIRGSTPDLDYRQLLVVDRLGRSVVHSGSRSLGLWADAVAENVACGGNLLATKDVPARMVDAFASSSGELGDRLVRTMQAGLEAGGEAGDVHSAGLMIVHEVPWPVADLRVDWTEGCPISELSRLWERYRPQMRDYVRRALDPSDAPSYGVPGDP